MAAGGGCHTGGQHVATRRTRQKADARARAAAAAAAVAPELELAARLAAEASKRAPKGGGRRRWTSATVTASTGA